MIDCGSTGGEIDQPMSVKRKQIQREDGGDARRETYNSFFSHT
jgi:hypothetical protein